MTTPSCWSRPAWSRPRGPWAHLTVSLNRAAIQRWDRGCADPRTATREALARVLDAAAGTHFAEEHGLVPGMSLADYREAVPIRRSEVFDAWLSRAVAGDGRALVRHPIVAWNQTSGTTGTPRLIPVTEPWAAEVAAAQRVWVAAMVCESPEIAAIGAASWSVVGRAVEGETAAGVPFGANAARMAARQPWWVRIRQPVPAWVADVRDPELRMYIGLRLALAHDLRVWTTANPTTFLALGRIAERYAEALARDLVDGTLRGGPAAHLDPRIRRRLGPWIWRRRLIPAEPLLGRYWPNLRAVNCWKGGQAAWFLPAVRRLVSPADPVIREVGISASEAHIGVALHSDWDGGVVAPGGALLEFLPEDGGEVRELAELSVGDRVRPILSTTAGLYRYDLGDVLEVTGKYLDTPIVRFLRRTGDTSSLTGEKLTAEQVTQAAEGVLPAAATFVLAAVLAEIPFYRLGLEEGDVEAAAAALDVALRRLNVEYGSKRESGRLGPLVGARLPPGTWERWRSRRLSEGAADGQVKERLLVDEAGWRSIVGE